MILVYLCLGMGVMLVASFLVVRVSKGGLPAMCLKAGASIFFLLTSFSAMYLLKAPVYGYFILIGQVFGLIGDIFLDQKYVHPEQESFYTHIGFSAFGMGHLFFVAGLFLTFSFTWMNIVIAAAAAVMITAFIYFSRKPMKLDYGNFTMDTVLYTAVIAFVTVLPATLLIPGGNASRTATVFFAGMVLFLLSDVVLSQIYFGTGKNIAPYIISNLLLYYSAQYIISYSILCLA